MKRYPKLPSILRSGLLLLGTLLATSFIRGDETPSRSIDETFTFDERGDARLEISFGFGAAQWQQWRELYGDHPDILLRDLRYQLASGVIEDFKLDKDDINRKAVCKLKVRALARYRNGGQFVIDIPKDLKMVTGSGTEWVFTKSSMSGNAILNETQRAKLPAGAQNARLSEGGDYNELSYSVNLNPPRPKAKLAVGILLLVVGVALAMVPPDRAKGLLVHVHPPAPPAAPQTAAATPPPPPVPPAPPLGLPGPGNKA
jgi:hypothetical protein